MAPFPDLLILRHGETEWNRQGRMQGALDSDLTELGRAQAQAQGDLLAAYGAEGYRWFSSPQKRAATTAEIAAPEGQEIRTDPRLREIGMGQWAGRSRQEIAEERPELFSPDAPPLAYYGQGPGCESIASLAARVTEFLSELTGPSVIVTHGMTSRVLRCIALGLAPAAFAHLNGGQGVVFAVTGAGYFLLGESGTTEESFPRF